MLKGQDLKIRLGLDPGLVTHGPCDIAVNFLEPQFPPTRKGGNNTFPSQSCEGYGKLGIAVSFDLDKWAYILVPPHPTTSAAQSIDTHDFSSPSGSVEGYGFSLLVYHPKLGTQEKSCISLAKVFRACLCVTWLKPGLTQVPHLYEVTHVEFTELFRTSLSFRGRARRKGERRILLAFNNQVGLGIVIRKL